MSYTLWPFEPQPEYTERLAWVTDVLATRAGEQRISLTPYPDITLAFDYDLADEDLTRSRQLRNAIGIGDVLVPLWEQCQHVGAIGAHTVDLILVTTGRDYAEGGYLMVWDDNGHAEYCLIDAIDGSEVTLAPWVVDAYGNAYVMPMVAATFSKDLAFQRREVPSADVSVAFKLATAPILTPAGSRQYLSHELSVYRPHLWGNRSETFTREFGTLASGAGAYAYAETRTAPQQTSVISWYAGTRTQTQALRAWLHGRKGRQVSFWSPTWHPDITVTHAITAGDTTVEIEECDYGTYFSNPTDFALIRKDGVHVGFRGTTAAAPSSGKQILTVTPAFSTSHALGDIEMTSKITLSRLASDSLEIQHLGSGQCKCATTTIEVIG